MRNNRLSSGNGTVYRMGRSFKKFSVNAKYWFTVIELESILFMFMKSLRFDFICHMFKRNIMWILSLDHTHHEQ